MTLEEEYLAGEISSTDFLYLLLSRTEKDIVQTDPSQTMSDTIDYCPFPLVKSTQECIENKSQRTQLKATPENQFYVFLSFKRKSIISTGDASYAYTNF